jgi:predicted DNA-binding transcriptional regulator YafY
MPVNKNALFRYRIIDDALRGGRKCTSEALFEKVNEALYQEHGQKGISMRTFFYDLSHMQEASPNGYDAPIQFIDGAYSYSDKDFTIRQLPFTVKEREHIDEALKLLSQFKGLPHFDVLSNLFRPDMQLTGSIRQIIQFDVNQEVMGLQWMADLYRAIAQKSCLQIEYQPFNEDKPTNHLIHPYLLKEYKNRWFLFGMHDTEQKIWSLALDRMKGIKSSIKPFIQIDLFDPNTYFNDFVGISYPSGFEKQTIQFTVKSNQKQYFISKPLHSSQTWIEDSQIGAVFTLEVIPNYELSAELYRLGPDLVDVQPLGILDQVRSAYQK